jgi:membrane associated rhomboid family serine protease
VNVEFLSFVLLSLFYIIIQDKAAVLERLGRFGDAYQAVWGWIRENMSKVIRDEEDWEGAWSTHSLIMLNVAAFVISLGIGFEQILADFAFIPALASEAWRWVTYQFLHAPVPAILAPFSAHLLFNMLFLYVFGDNVEKWIERFRLVKWGTELNVYAGLYVIFGVIAAAAQATVVGWGSYVLMVGASGAISGILGMYLVLFPDNKVYVAGRETLPASVYLLIWFVSQFGLEDPTIASAAHIAGFLSGVAVAIIFKKVESLSATGGDS